MNEQPTSTTDGPPNDLVNKENKPPEGFVAKNETINLVQDWLLDKTYLNKCRRCLMSFKL